MGNNDFEINGVINLSANLSQFSSDMESIKETYNKSIDEMDSKKVSSPLNNESTKDNVTSAYKYAMNIFGDKIDPNSNFGLGSGLQDRIALMNKEFSRIPQALQNAMSGLVTGLHDSIDAVSTSLETATQKMSKSFNLDSFTNNIRFAAASAKTYMEDMEAINSIVKRMSPDTKSILEKNVGQISSVVNPAIRKIALSRNDNLSDIDLRHMLMTGQDYSHIPQLLNSYGIQANSAAMRDILDFAIKSTSSRIYRRDAAINSTYAGMKTHTVPAVVTDLVSEPYKASLLTAGRFISDETTPRNTQPMNLRRNKEYYDSIKREVRRGNSVAYHAAVDSGLISLNGDGTYSFAQAGQVVKNKKVLDQYSALVNQSTSYAAQGSPNHRTNLSDPYDQSRILNRDTVRLKEGTTMIAYDLRPDADPYLDPNYQNSITAYDRKHSSIVPKLKIPEMIHIPRMVVRNVNGKHQLMIKDSKVESGYRPNIDFNWQKRGVEESPDDEAITMGRNPLLDALIKMHAGEGAKFEDRTYGWGRDSEGKAKGGVPLMIDMSLDDLYDKNSYGEMLFDEIKDSKGRTIRKSRFGKGNAELVRGLYSGEIKPILKFPTINADGKEEMKDYTYRVIAGNLKDSGNMKMILQSDYEKLMEESPFLPMLYYFNETEGKGIDKNAKLINSKTGKAYGNTAKGLEAYTKFFDARNKMLSHSLPIEEMGVDTPLAALVNLEAFYEANNTPKSERFDGGGFIDSKLFTRDFQARMGPAKFLAQRFNWRKWFQDSGFAYKGGEGENDKAWHMYMPGMSASAEDYKKYRTALQNNVGLDDTSFTIKDDKGNDQIIDFGGKTFKNWRNQRFVDVMQSDIGMLLADTTLKTGHKLSSLTPDTYNKIVSEVNKAGYKAPKAMQGRQTSFLFPTNDKNFDKSLLNENGMVSLTPTQQTELMAIISNPDNFFGLRMMKDTENYAGTKNFWSPAYMSSVQMSPKLIKQSMDNYRQAFRDLSTPQGIIKRMFSGRDADSIRVQNDPTLIQTDRNIQYAIQSEIQDLQEKQLQGYGYFPGTAHMMLATVNPNSVFGVYGENLTGKKLKGPAKELNMGKEGVIAPSLNGKDIYSWTRSPYAPGANFFGSRYARTAANRYGLTGESAMFNVADFYTLNTGDFDGDFVWAYATLEDDKEFVKQTNERNKRLADRAKKREADNKRRQKAMKGMVGENKDAALDFNVDDFALGVLRANDTLNPTGLGYKAGQAGRMVKLSAEDLAYVDDYGNDTYAAAIDMLKHTDVQATAPVNEAVLKAIRSRKPIERLTQALYKEAHNEKYGGTNIFDYGLPTYFDQMGIGLLAGAAEGRLADPAGFGSTIADAIHQNIETRYAGRTKQEKNLADWYGGLLTDKLTGKYQITSAERLAEGDNLVSALEAKTKELEKTNPESQEVKDMQALARKAKSAIQTERVAGFSEGTLGDIQKYYDFMGWENPIQKYGLKTELQQSAATILIENERRKQQERIQESIDQQVDRAIAESSGTTVNPDRREEMRQRILAANKFTGFNWSNSKHFMDQPLRAQGVRWSTLEGEDKGFIRGSNDGYLVVDFNDSAPTPSGMNVSNREQVARSILTGDTLATRIDADALVGTAAHRYMELYGAYRTSGGVGSKQNKSIQEAKDLAYQGFKESLLGGANGLSEAELAAQRKAGVYFEEDKDGYIVAKLRDEVKDNPYYKETLQRVNEKLQLASRASMNDPKDPRRGKISSLDETAEKYFESAYQGVNGTSHMIMAEGVKFDDKGRQLPSNSKKGNNGIWIIPQRDGEAVVKFQRFKKGSAGNIEESQPGMYFTPDMIKKDENTGKITITDWKSSEHGQQEAMFQMPFYAHQLEELGKTYHLSGGKRKDLEWFGQFVTQDPFSGKFSSNIEAVQAVNLYAKDKNKAVMSRKYDESIGNYVSRMVEAGMNNLASSAAVGFAAELRESITPRTQGRKADEGRATLGPDQIDKDYSNLGGAENLDDEIQRNIRRYEQIGGGGTGVMDKDGNFIDTDKSYLTARFMKDEETLKNIKSFAGKQSRKINNLRFGQQDEFTQNIDELSTLFSQDQFAAIQDYLTKKTNPNFNQYTPDVKMLTKDFDRNQIESMNVMERLMDLRKAYVAQLPETMQLDYDSILYGKGDAMSKLSSAQGKRERDLSALRGVYTNSQYYNSLTGTFKTEAEFYNDLAPELKAGETTRSKSYKDRVKKAKVDAKVLAKAAQQEEADFTKQANEINNAYNGFSVSWQKEFDKNLEQEFPSLSDLFKNDNLQEAVIKIKQKAEQYKQMANQKQVGGPGGYAHTPDERLKLIQAYNKLTAKATDFEQLNGSDFAKLIENPKKLEEAKLQSMLTGVSVDYETKRDAELTKFAQAYLAVHPNASAKTITRNVDRVRARMDQEHKEQTERDNERNIANSIQSGLSLRSEYNGVPITAEEQAMIQARKLRQKVKDRRSELKSLLKDEKDNNVRKQYQDELNELTGMTLKGAYSRYLGQARADENLRNYNISKSETSLNRLFGGNAPLSLQETVDDAIANANAQIEQYIKLAGLNAGDADKIRRRYKNKQDLQKEIEEQYNQQLEHEKINDARKQASIQERLTGRKTSSFEQADIAVEAMRSEIHDYRRSILKKARRKDISDEERNRLMAEAWQYDDRNVDYEGYRDRLLRESAREQAQTRRSNEIGVRNLTDISSDKRLTAAERTNRRMEDLRHGVKDRISKVYNDYVNGAYTGKEKEFANIMRTLLNYDYAGAESRIQTEELYADKSFEAKQEADALRMRSVLENRSLTRDEYTKATQAKLRKERDDYIAQQIRDKQMTEAEAKAYTTRYNDPYLLGIAQQQTDYEYGQRELSLQMEGRQLEATLSGRSFTRDEMIAQRRDQLEQQARAYAEKLRKENKRRAANNFLRNYLPNINQIAQEEVENRLMYDEETSRNQAYAHQIQNAATLRQQQYSAEDFIRQQRNRHIHGAIFGALQPYKERTISLNRNIQGYKDQKDIAQRELALINKKLADKRTTQEERYKLEAQKDIKTQDINKYNEQIKATNEEMESLSSVSTKVSAVLMGFGDVISRIGTRLGRQLFRKALQETKRFVKEFDSSMNEIQAITLKSNNEMQDVRSQTINKALGLRTSVSNVANVEAALYRQGLNDAEVSTRTDSIIKFATVTKLNVQEATKIITTALQNDLVDSANAAMDALVALGDSAATTAAEIGKGMQKAAASAKVAGVSYAELTALLTIGTSDTQLSGTQVGTALQTVFTRMRRISTTGWAADQNGEKTSASDAEAALKAVGVDLWDDKNLGRMRSAYDIMLDLSKVWQNLSDAQKSIVTGALAGTRQTNIFSTLMEGMSEDGGETLEKYLGLAEDSEGITQSKYEIAMQSLAASMDEFKSSFDALIESMVNSGSLTGSIDGISDLFQGIANIANNGGQAGIVLGVIAGGIAAIGVAISGIATGPAGVLLQILAAIAGFGAIAGLTSLFTGDNRTEVQKHNDERAAALEEMNQFNANDKAQANYLQKSVENVRKYGKEWQEVKDSSNIDTIIEAQENLRNSLSDLAVAFPEISGQVLNAIKDLSQWEEAVNKAGEIADDFSDRAKQKEKERIEEYQAYYLDQQLSDEALALGSPETMVKLRRATYNAIGSLIGTANTGDLSQFDFAASQNLFAEHKGQYGKTDILRNLYYWTDDEDTREFIRSFFEGSIAGDVLVGMGEHGRPDNAADVQTLNAGYDRLMRYLFSESANNPEFYKQSLRGIDTKAIRQLVSERTDFDNLIPENADYSADNYRSAVLSLLLGEVYNENGELNPEYNLNGRVDFSKVRTKLNEYGSKNVEQIQNIIDTSNSPDKIYSVDGNRFFTESAARKFIEQSGGKYNTSNIEKSGAQMYQTADKLISAAGLQAQKESDQRRIDNILEGYTKIGQLESPQLLTLAKALTPQGANETEEVYNDRIKQVVDDLQLGNIDTTSEAYKKAFESLSLPKGLTEYSDFSEVIKAYADADMSSVLSSFVSSSPERLGAWLLGEQTGNYSLFTSAVQSSQAGSMSISDYMSGLVTMLAQNPEIVESFASDFEGVYNAFKSFFGSDSDRILTAMKDQTYLSDEDMVKFVNDTITNSRVTKDFGTKRYLQSDLTKMAQKVASSGAKSWTEARSKLDFTESDWSALENAYPKLKEFMELSEEQQATEEGQRVKLEYEIAIAISGISELEQAGEVLQGTANLIEGLKRGGEFAIKAKIEFESSLYNNQQLSAKLANGTFAQQLEAIQALTGLSTTQIMQDFPRYLEEAKAMSNGKTAESINEIAARGNVDYAREQAEKYGYTWNEAISEKDASDNLIKMGFHERNGHWYDDAGNLSVSAEEYYTNAIRGYASGQGKVGKIDYENPLLGRSYQYDNFQINEAQRALLSLGSFNSIQMWQNANSELSAAAMAQLGVHGQNYLAMLSENAALPEEERRYSPEQILEERNKAFEEINSVDKEFENSLFNNAMIYQKGANAFKDLSSEENRQILANTIGKTTEQITEAYKAGDIEGLTEDLGEAFNKIIEDPMLEMIASLAGIDISQYSDFDSLIDGLTGALDGAEEGIKELIESMINILTQAKNAADSSDITSFSAMFEKETSQFGERRINDLVYQALSKPVELQEVQEFDKYGKLTGTRKETYAEAVARQLDAEGITSWNNFSEKSLLSALIGNYGNGVTDETMNAFIRAGQSGIKNIDYYTALGQASVGPDWITNAGTIRTISSEQDRQALLSRLLTVQSNTSGLGEIFSEYAGGTDAIQSLINILSEADAPLESINKELKLFQDNMSEKQREKIERWGNASQRALDKTSSYVSKMSKISNQTARYNSILGRLNDPKNAGKTGKDIFSGSEGKKDKSALLERLTGVTEDELDSMGADMIKKLAEGAKDAGSEEWSNVANSIMTDFATEINSLSENQQNEIVFDLKTAINADGSWDVSKLAEIANKFQLDVENALAAYDGMGGTLSADITPEELTIEWLLSYARNGGFTGTPGAGKKSGGGGGGGGGGGKSELDKMLERQKHEVSNVEHRIKMTQIEEEFANHMNNQGQYLYYLDNEISLQKELAGVLETNISELQAQISTLEAGTDEWYKATQQLWEYEESLSNIKNTIFELGGKRIEIEAKIQDIADKPGSYIGSMLQMRADRYQSLGQFENYESAMKKVMSQTQADIDLNNDQIRQWENMLSLYMEGDENWIEVRDKIWEIKQENAQLENDLLNSTLDLQQARIDQIATDLQNSMAPYEHELNMLSTFGQMYQNNEQWGSYRSTLTQTNDYSRDQIKMYEDTIVELRKQMAALEEGSAAWYSARDAIYQYEEAIAQANATMQENEASMRESYITELAAKFQDAEANIQHEMNMAKTTTERFDKDNDFVNYQNMLREQLDLTEQSLELYNGKLGEMENLLSSGKVGEGGEQWRNLKEQILALREEINNTEASYEELERLIAQSQLEHIIERFNMFDELSQHNIKMIQYEETRYQTQGELTNVNTMLGYENAEQRKRAELIVAHIEQLKEQRDQLEAGSDSYKKATTEIYKWEEQLKQVNNTIEKNTETIKKNEEAILKTYKTLEDSLNNEIKTRKQEERDQLSATVSLQKSILDVIRARYRAEWG